ncbi:MAG TPA: FemAB family XrtA/PEP-CTERM system-associated protein [Planctomycetota bacterium]
MSAAGLGTPPAPLVRAGLAGDDPQRDAYVRAHPRGTFFHLSGWRRMVERVHGHEPLELLAFEGERLVGVLPLMLCRAPFLRARLVSMPYATYGGPLGDDAAVEARLVGRARELAEELRVAYLELRCIEDAGLGLVPNTLYSTFVRDLPADPADVLARMPKKARAEARKAREKHGLELASGHWYLDDLRRMFLLNKHELGSPGLPRAHFQALLELFERSTWVHLVRQGTRPRAAVMSFAFGKTLIAYYAGTEPGADRAVSASNFMYMALQEWAVERGFERFDFCRSRADSGAFEFKRHQGFEPTPLHYGYHFVRRKKLPSFTPSNPRTGVLRAAWSRLPLWMARALTERLPRYLP